MLATDCWGASSSQLTFTVTVIPDTAPTFIPSLPANKKVTYPQSTTINTVMVDAEGNPASIQSTITFPSFVTYSKTGDNVAITITPVIASAGTYTLSFTLSDTVKTATYTFNVVINTAPSF